MYGLRGLRPYIREDTQRGSGLWYCGKSQRALACIELYRLYWAESYGGSSWYGDCTWRSVFALPCQVSVPQAYFNHVYRL